jgi:hypothetical protein
VGECGERHSKVGAYVRIIGESGWMQVGAAGDEVDDRGEGGGIRTRVGRRRTMDLRGAWGWLGFEV